MMIIKIIMGMMRFGVVLSKQFRIVFPSLWKESVRRPGLEGLDFGDVETINP